MVLQRQRFSRSELEITNHTPLPPRKICTDLLLAKDLGYPLNLIGMQYKEVGVVLVSVRWDHKR